MDFELSTTTHGQHGDFGQARLRRNFRACALIALALVGCAAEAVPPDTSSMMTTGATAPTSVAATAGAAAPGTPAATPASTQSGTMTAAPATPAGTTAAAPAGMMMATTPAGMTTPSTGAPMTPPAAPGMSPATPGNPGAMMAPPVELPVETGTPTLFWLDITGNTVYTASASGGMQKRFASGSPLSAPDGVAVDTVMGYVYVLNMGSVLGGGNSGSLVRYKLDGSGAETIMPPGSKADGQTFNTGKQVSMDKVNRKLYLGDREGSKVWRCDMDGKNLEVLISGHDIQQVVGVAPDPIKKQFYFSDRNGKKLFRASMDMPMGQTHADRKDVELLYVDKAPNAMPLDIELDVSDRKMYWTDRQQNTVFTMSMDMPAGMDGNTRTDVKAVKTGLIDVIGLGFDHEAKVLYATHSGSVSSFKVDGSEQKSVGSSGVTGIAFTKIK